MSEHKAFPPIEDVTLFDQNQSGPFIGNLHVIAALDPSTNYPNTRITIAIQVGTASLDVRQARALRDQLDAAIADVVTACPEVEHG